MTPGASDHRIVVVDPAIGLSTTDVEARLADGRCNTVAAAPGRTMAQILRANVLTRFNALLTGLLVVVAVVGPLQDGLFGVILVVNTAVGVSQEVRAKRALERLAILNAPVAHVVRQGVVHDVDPADVVLDDVLEIRPGDQIVVDGRVLRAELLQVDESLLSGEAEPASKAIGALVRSGSFVVAGVGRIQATAVGADAYAAGVEAQVRRFRPIRSELQQGTNSILRLVTWVMVPTGTALVLTQLLRSHQARADALRGSVAGIAAMIPEGLVLLTSLAFAVGALRLARHRVLVQELPAVEGLARVDVLCIDKTGTLTASASRLHAIVPLEDAPGTSTVEEAVGALVAADPAPNATLRALEAVGRDPGWHPVARVPFSSERKWSAVTFDEHGSWLLGAPERLAGRCASVQSAVSGIDGAAHRLLLLGWSPFPVEAASVPRDVLPVALLVLDEELRPAAATTVRYLLDQGVAVKVLSGDAPTTVARVAQRVGIPKSAGCDGSGLEGDAELAAALASTDVIGRIEPEQKRSAVRILQEQGHVVAMVGDGVNDVQALKDADLGIAMGSGSQSARAVARVVLLDSDFAEVPRIVAEGRRVIANIERVANVFVTKTVYAALLAVIVAVSAAPFPFFPRHLTIVSTVTIGVPGFFLALAGGAPRATPGFARRVLRFAAPAGAAGAAVTYGVFALARADASASATQARTAAMLALVGFGLWVLVLVARPLQAWKVALIGAMAGGVAVPFVVPFARRAFDLAAPPPMIMAAVAASVVLAALGLRLARVRPADIARSSPGAGLAETPGTARDIVEGARRT